ncbi:hypothetical protein ACFQX6_15095 [Streptosporangium lutulentum]
MPLATAALALLTALPAQADGSQPDSVQANAAQQAARKPAAPPTARCPAEPGGPTRDTTPTRPSSCVPTVRSARPCCSWTSPTRSHRVHHRGRRAAHTRRGLAARGLLR